MTRLRKPVTGTRLCTPLMAGDRIDETVINGR